jgi:hypothetical protein
MRSAIATCLGQGIQLSVRAVPVLIRARFLFCPHKPPEVLRARWLQPSNTFMRMLELQRVHNAFWPLPAIQVASVWQGQGPVPQDLRFRSREHGKPELDCGSLPKRARYIDFNLTGTAGMLAVAVSSGVKIGIDCERWDRQLKFPAERVAKRWYSPQEHEQLMGALATLVAKTCQSMPMALPC